MRSLLVMLAFALGCTTASEPAPAPSKATVEPIAKALPPEPAPPEPEPEPPKPEPPKPAPAKSLAVDLSTFDLSCRKHSDCTLVRAAPCGVCGCTEDPIRVVDHDRFIAERAKIECPPPTPLPGGAGCGGCPNFPPRCQHGKCTLGR